jgi:hypothetical protein
VPLRPRHPRFRSSAGGGIINDIWDWFHRGRFIIATIAVILPVVVLTNNKAILARWHRLHPVPEATRLVSTGIVTQRDTGILLRACREQPDRPDLLRALAESCAATDPAQARRCYDRLAKLGATTDADAANHALLLAKLQAYSDAEAALSHLKPEAENNPAVHRAWVLVRCAAGDFKRAAESLDALLAIVPDDAATCLQAAEFAARQSAADAMAARLEKRSIDALALKADSAPASEIDPLVAQLIALPLRNKDVRTRASRLLNALPEANLEQKLAATLLRHPSSLSGPEQEAFATEFLGQIKNSGGLSAEVKGRVAALLQRQHQHALVVALIAPEESYTESSLFDRRYDSLLQLGQWRDAIAMTRDVRAPKPTHGEHLISALDRLDRDPRNSTATNGVLAEALREACEEKSTLACYTVGCVALEMRMPQIATEAFAHATDLSTHRDQTVDDIINTSRRSGLPVAAVLYSIQRSGVAGVPSDFIQRQLCYLRLVAGQQIPAAREFITRQSLAGGDDPQLRLLQALSEYREGRFAEVLRLLVPLPNHRWQQGEAAVIASLVSSAGSFERCAALIGQIDPARIFPEERAMLEPWRARLMIEQNPALAPQKLQASNP